ncbi:4-fold beta flower protein [Herbiconiux sp. SYSU D00978]|uniref:4-fold beta flower protein n=1 Tax=Herbiconiux sp. SYSU D00978 TaxID=2812562 RepID=UPI001A97859C|nr:hypothetical protein [Herbiconiux sp. SYSU D00978]
MDAIYGRTGAVVGWLSEFDRVYGLSGNVTGWIGGSLDDEARPVYGLHGTHVGWLTHGLFWDHEGLAVAFLVGSSGGPPRPVRQAHPVQPVRHTAPPRPEPEQPRPPAPRRPEWSQKGLAQLMLHG